jgi:hypothetical protein
MVAAVQRSNILNNTEKESRRRGRNKYAVRVGEAVKTTVEAGSRVTVIRWWWRSNTTVIIALWRSNSVNGLRWWRRRKRSFTHT